MNSAPSRPPWHHGTAPVTSDLLGVVIWTGRTWAATTYGVERLDGGQAISERHLGLDWIARCRERKAVR